MPRLIKSEAKQWAARFKLTMAPSAMQAEVDLLRERIGFWALAKDATFRDAYVAALFACARGASGVRLGDDPPDFHLSGIDGCDTFETVETFLKAII